MSIVDPMLEQVLCIDASRLDVAGRFQGFCGDVKLINDLFSYDNHKYFSFRPRSEVEDDPSTKQIVTYSVIQHGNRDDRLVFSYTRGKAGGEDRLKRKRSIGVGGHVSESVMADQTAIGKLGSRHHFSRSSELIWCKVDAMREINEEVSYKSTNPLLVLLGLINDDSNPVGQVHLGLVYCLLCSNADVESNDPSVSDGSMVLPSDLIANREHYESWSQILIDSLYAEK